MVDFVKSFQQGLTSADAARKNKNEIESVFAELNEQLHSATKGKVQIKIVSYGLQPSILPGAREYFSYDVIQAINPLVDSSSKMLAKWSQHPEGYPCTITIGKTEYVCEDKEALEGVLATMLQDPSVGESLQALLNLESE